MDTRAPALWRETVQLATELVLADVAKALVTTSILMMMAGVLACVGPARRAPPIDPILGLKET